MASPDPEWLLWREQYKTHAKSVAHQLFTLNQATSQIADVTTKLANLTIKSDQLQAHNDALKERIERLDEDATYEHGLTERLQRDNDVLRDRIVHLEQDANQQDQINAINSQSKSDLEVRLAKLKEDFMNVIEAVATMQQTTKKEREKQNESLTEMKAQMAAFVETHSRGNVLSLGRDQRYPIGNLPVGDRDNRAEREMSQATTADDSMQVDQLENTSILDPRPPIELPGTTRLCAQYLEDTQVRRNSPNIRFVEQGNSTIEEYLKYGERVLPEGVMQFEMQAVKTFIGGLRDKYAQQLLSGRLDRVGWTWEKAKEEINHILEEGSKRKRNRRTMPVFA